MSARYRVTYAEDALLDLREIAAYIANDLSSPQAARDVVGRIRDAAKGLSTMPSRHALVDWEPWLSKGVRGMLVGNHKVFYVVDDDVHTVTVSRVLYARMDLRGEARDSSE